VPIYEYICKTCGERFEIKQKFSDPPITTCAAFSCGKGEPVEKIISSPAIMFKGTGWYVTDYSDKLKEPKKRESEGKPSGDKVETKSDSAGSDRKAGNGSSGQTASSASSTASDSSSAKSSTESSSSKKT
jgi:putative FmdB family regulatory protein